MSAEIIQQCLNARPFVPFSLSLTDHRDYRVGGTAEVELTSDGTAIRFKFASGHVFVALNHVISVTLESQSGGAFGFASALTK